MQLTQGTGEQVAGSSPAGAATMPEHPDYPHNCQCYKHPSGREQANQEEPQWSPHKAQLRNDRMNGSSLQKDHVRDREVHHRVFDFKRDVAQCRSVLLAAFQKSACGNGLNRQSSSRPFKRARGRVSIHASVDKPSGSSKFECVCRPCTSLFSSPDVSQFTGCSFSARC